jgi:hypothetical protein
MTSTGLYDADDIIAMAEVAYDTLRTYRRCAELHVPTEWLELPEKERLAFTDRILTALYDTQLTPEKMYAEEQFPLTFQELSPQEQLQNFLLTGIITAFRLYAYSLQGITAKKETP